MNTVKFEVESYKDNIGNIIGFQQGTSSQKLMLTAHADTIGFIIKYVSSDGFLYFHPIGGVDLAVLPGTRVKIEGIHQDIIGVIGRCPIHCQRPESLNAPINIEDLWIDIGADDREEAMRQIQLGAQVSFVSDVINLSNNIIAGSGLDNGMGIEVLNQLSKRLKKVRSLYNIYYVATVQEEMGFRGAQVAGSIINPDICIVVDMAHATDFPDCNQARYGEIKLGEGIVFPLAPDVDRTLCQHLMGIAKKHNIPYQLEPNAFPTGTEANVIQMIGTGIQTVVIGIPCRYMHTPNEMVSLDDVNAAIKLISLFIKNNSKVEK